MMHEVWPVRSSSVHHQSHHMTLAGAQVAGPRPCLQTSAALLPRMAHMCTCQTPDPRLLSTRPHPPHTAPHASPHASSQAQIVATQPAERQAHLATCLDKLMSDVQRNLEPKNRDKFTQVGGHGPCVP